MATKIDTIHITNLKAIAEADVNLRGCSAIVTGKNNGGKSTLLRGIPDRIRGEIPEIIVRENEDMGRGEMLLTSGEKFIWEFDTAGMDKLSFITKEGYKMGVTKEISKRFFPAAFDIDEFLTAPPKEQTKMLQKLVGVDFTDIDRRYKIEYDNRTDVNRTAEKESVKLTSFNPIPEEISPVDIRVLIQEKETIRKRLTVECNELYRVNNEARVAWEEAKERLRTEIEQFNKAQELRTSFIQKAKTHINELMVMGYDGTELEIWLNRQLKPEPKKEYVAPPKPNYVPEIPDDKDLREIDNKINNAGRINEQAQHYSAFIAQTKIAREAKEIAEKADREVKIIEAEKKEILKKSKFPEGFELTDRGIMVDGFPLDKNQISSSKLYCAALRLGAISLGEVKALHFDASTLDKNTLSDIEAWAKANDLQLLIERPDFEAGEIKYTLIES